MNKLPIKSLVVLLIVASATLLIPMPQLGRAGHAAADLLHAPCFAVLAVVVFRLLSSRFQKHPLRLAFACGIGLIVFSAATELAQAYFGRQASWGDFFANVAGTTAGLLIVLARERPNRIARFAVAGALLVIAMLSPALTLTDVAIARWQFPQLASFEQPLEMRRWQAKNCKIARVGEHATDGQFAMRLDLSPAKFPGAFIDFTERNWSAYDTLALDITWPADETELNKSDFESLKVIVKVEDEAHNDDYYDRFHLTVALAHGVNSIRIPLTDIANAPRGRPMDMTRIRILQIFTIDLEQPATLYIDNLRLE